MTREELEAVRNHISNLPTVGAMYAPVLVEWVSVLLRQRDEVTAQRDNAVDASKEGAWMARALDAERERDEALAQVARRDREHEALSETAQKALAHVEAERDKARAAQEESEHQMHLRIRSGYDKTIADSWRAKVAEVERERDELKARLDHAEADAEQAIHNEAFMERQRIVAWIRARLARSVMDDRVSIRERGVMADLAEGIDRGWHEATQ